MKTQSESVSPTHIANFLLIECRERGDIFTNLKLQKLLYYAQAWYLALRGQSPFHRGFQAWVHGPALPSQYKRFKNITSGVPSLKRALSRPKIKNLDISATPDRNC